MRKSILQDSAAAIGESSSDDWLNLEEIATAEISSEDPNHPFENALRDDSESGWKAAIPGPQVIRLKFDRPHCLRRIRLVFRENQRERSQEFAIIATSAAQPRKEIVRQQWQFSPGGSNIEVENYSINLRDVSSLELEIDPGRHDPTALASLEFLGIA